MPFYLSDWSSSCSPDYCSVSVRFYQLRHSALDTSAIEFLHTIESCELRSTEILSTRPSKAFSTATFSILIAKNGLLLLFLIFCSLPVSEFFVADSMLLREFFTGHTFWLSNIHIRIWKWAVLSSPISILVFLHFSYFSESSCFVHFPHVHEMRPVFAFPCCLSLARRR